MSGERMKTFAFRATKITKYFCKMKIKSKRQQLQLKPHYLACTIAACPASWDGK